MDCPVSGADLWSETGMEIHRPAFIRRAAGIQHAQGNLFQLGCHIAKRERSLQQHAPAFGRACTAEMRLDFA